jgi:serine/threonine protein kinase
MADVRALLSDVLPGYDLGDEIGRGGWGVVFAAEHRTLERRVAIKHLPGAFGSDPSARARFRSEARVVASLDHPHIVPLFDFVERDDLCVFVMEIMPGGTLWDRFEAGDVEPTIACAVSLAVLGALHHAHEHGVLHRDVKPENVLFSSGGRPKLADFGIAKVLGEGAGTRTATGTILGTPAYMAPEQGSGEPVTPATDIYAVGVMLYELLSGRLPFESTGNALSQLYRHVHEEPALLGTVAPSIPPGLCDVVMRAMRKAPSDRWPSAREFASALDDAACAAFGDDWLASSGVPVLATRTGSRRPSDLDPSEATPAPVTTAPTSTPPPSTAPPAPPPPAPATPPPGPTAPLPGPGVAPQAPAPHGGAPTSAPPGTPAPPASPPSWVPTPAPAPEPSGGGRVRTLALGAVGVAVVVAVAIAALSLGGGSPDEDQAATTVPVESATFDAIAFEQRWQAACAEFPDLGDLCECAYDAALAELSDAELQAQDQLFELFERRPEDLTEEERAIVDGGLNLTVEVVAIFDRCRDDAGA